MHRFPQSPAVPPGWQAEDANPLNRREVWYQPAQTQPQLEPRPRKHRSRNSAAQRRHKAEKAKKTVEDAARPEPTKHLNTTQTIPSSAQGGGTEGRPTRRGKRAGASKGRAKQSAESEANDLGLEEESDPSHPSTPSQASEELPINSTSADGDVNRGEDAVNDQHVASLVAPIDSSHTSANATSSEPNPTASFTQDNLIPVEGKASLEETVALTDCQDFVCKIIVLDAFEKVQNCAAEDQAYSTGSLNTLHLSTPGLKTGSHKTDVAMKSAEADNNTQAPAPKKVSLKQAFKSGGYLAATYFCAGVVVGVAEGMARGVGLLLRLDS